MDPDSPDVADELSARDDAALKALLDRHRIWLETGGADGARAGLAGACLRGVSWWHADLRGADLAGADLGGANLDHVSLRDASLAGARLTGASLWKADLGGADLAAADLRDAKLDHAVLRAARVRGADFAGASLWGAHLEGADLRDAVGLTPAQLEVTSRDAGTRLPAPPDPAGPTPPAQAAAGDDPVVLDEHRGMAAQRATELRRLRAEVEAQRAALHERQAALERHFLAGPSATWEEAAEKARYLITLLADTPEGRDPRRRKVIAGVLEDFARLSAGPAGPVAPGDPDASGE